MAIAPIETIQNSIQEDPGSGLDVIDKNEFLLLFVTQLQNQDPLSPMENSELASQTAQFASLEQLQYINENLENLQKYQSAIFDENAVSFIGKRIKATDNAIDLAAGSPADIQFDLERDATGVNVSIYDSNEQFITEIIGSSQSAGRNTLTWDGTMIDGVTPAPEGRYYATIQAVDNSGETFYGFPFIEAIVTEVNFWNGTAYLTAGGRDIAIGSVQKVTEGE